MWRFRRLYLNCRKCCLWNFNDKQCKNNQRALNRCRAFELFFLQFFLVNMSSITVPVQNANVLFAHSTILKTSFVFRFSCCDTYIYIKGNCEPSASDMKHCNLCKRWTGRCLWFFSPFAAHMLWNTNFISTACCFATRICDEHNCECWNIHYRCCCCNDIKRINIRNE